MGVKDQPWSIVTGKKNKRVVGKLFLPERFQHLADRPVDLLNHVAIQAALAYAAKAGGGKQRHMRQAVGEVNEKGFRLVFLDVLDSFLGVTPGDGGLYGRSFDNLGIAHQGHIPKLHLWFPKSRAALGRIGHTIHVVGVGNAKVSVEAIVRRQELRQMPEMPFADGGGGVAFRFQSFRQRDFTLRQSTSTVWKQHTAFVAAHAAAYGQPSGEQRRAAGRAHGSSTIKLRELDTLRRHAIEVWRGDGGMSEAPQIAIAHVIAEDDHKVRRLRAECRHCKKQNGSQGKKGLHAPNSIARTEGRQWRIFCFSVKKWGFF